MAVLTANIDSNNFDFEIVLEGIWKAEITFRTLQYKCTRLLHNLRVCLLE